MVAYYPEIVLRFLMLFVGLVAIQLLALRFATGFRIYAPFIHFVEPFTRRHFGGSDGGLAPVLISGIALGICVYSAVLAFVGALLISRGIAKPSSGV